MKLAKDKEENFYYLLTASRVKMILVFKMGWLSILCRLEVTDDFLSEHLSLP
jgi:hypothetical protein